jgi:hypothetical protein
VLVFERLPASRLLDDAWWLTVVTISACKSQPGVDEFYDRLIPYLLNAPIEHCLAKQRRAGASSTARRRRPTPTTTACCARLAATCCAASAV